jgi:16S rRNA (guanine527-N7)-methyltransferase
MHRIKSYFPNLSELQLTQLEQLYDVYLEWNAQINVISRKDIADLYLKHVLHSLAIAKVINFKDGTHILDVGTGGGFPGVPLAILFPNCHFHLIDSIAKKLKVVNAVSESLQLNNVKTTHGRAETIQDNFDFIVSRAVTAMPTFVSWTKNQVSKKSKHALKNGILYLKGGDLTKELQGFANARLFNIGDYFSEDFFETKKVVHIPLKFKGKNHYSIAKAKLQ